MTDLMNVDFWADRIAALIKLAEHNGMTVEITGGGLVVSRQVSETFTAQTEVRWRAEPAAGEAQQQTDSPHRPHRRRLPACQREGLHTIGHPYQCPGPETGA